jgi:hypothetical protein
MTATSILQSIIAMPVSQVWRGHGSALFIEFGELIERERISSRGISLKGAATLMIEWSWRIERPRSILCGSWSEEHLWPRAFEKLLSTNVTAVECFGHLPEISVTLSNGLRIVSLMTAEGQPSWALLINRPKAMSVRVSRGRLAVERGAA